jgi:hypothetical protein
MSQIASGFRQGVKEHRPTPFDGRPLLMDAVRADTPFRTQPALLLRRSRRCFNERSRRYIPEHENLGAHSTGPNVLQINEFSAMSRRRWSRSCFESATLDGKPMLSDDRGRFK